MSFAASATGSPGVPTTRPRDLPRRSAVAFAGAGLLAPLVARPARAAEITWRLGHSVPAEFPLHIRLMEAAGAITEQSGGKMRLEVHGNGELGGPIGLSAQLLAGKIDAAPMTSQLLAPNLALAALPMVGFAFTGYDRVWAALDGEAGAFLRQEIKVRLGIIAMERCWNFGFRQLSTNGKSVRTAADIEGMRLRTPPEAELVKLFQALKALPVAMPLGDLANALETRAVDGQESVVPLLKAAGLWQQQKTCALTNHVWDGHWICVAGKSWRNLPDDLKPVVARAFNDAALNQRKDTMEYDASCQRELEADGLTFNTIDTASFRSVLRKAGYYDSWRRKIGDDGWATLLKYSGPLD